MSGSEHSEPLGTTTEVATFLNVPVKTLDQWAYQGRGPKFSKVGRHRRYRWDDVRAFVDAGMRPTSAA